MHKFQRHLAGHVPEEPLSAAQDDGEDQQVELIQQARAQEPPHQGGTAADADALAGLLLELGDPRGDVDIDQG